MASRARGRRARDGPSDHRRLAGLKRGTPSSSELEFAALLERREAAARNLLHSDRTRRRNRSPADSSGPGDRLISAAHAGAGVEAGPATFVPLPDGRSKTDAQSELPVHVTTAASPLTRLHSLSTLPLSPPMLTRPRPLALPLTSAPLRLWHSRLMPPLLPSLRRLRPLAFPLTLPSLQLNKPRSRLTPRTSLPTLPRSRPPAFPLTRPSLQLKKPRSRPMRGRPSRPCHGRGRWPSR